MSDNILNEGSTALISLWFRDENDKNVTPTEIIWRLDDVTLMSVNAVSGEIIDWTTEVPTTYKHTVSIPNTANMLINSSNNFEEKLMTVKYYYGSGNVGTEEFRYQVKNLAKIT